MVKEDFIIGKWYAHNPYNDLNQLWYIKFLEFDREKNVRVNEYICNDKKYFCKSGHFGQDLSQFWEIPISEFTKYLPKNHPDLKQNILQSLEIW